MKNRRKALWSFSESVVCSRSRRKATVLKWRVEQAEITAAESCTDPALLGLTLVNVMSFLLQTTSRKRRRCSPSVTRGLVSSDKGLSFSVLDLGYSNKTIAGLLTHMNTCGSEAQFWWEIEFLYNRWMISHNAEGSGTGAVLRHGMLMGFAEYKPNGLIDRTWWGR